MIVCDICRGEHLVVKCRFGLGEVDTREPTALKHTISWVMENDLCRSCYENLKTAMTTAYYKELTSKR